MIIDTGFDVALRELQGRIGINLNAVVTFASMGNYDVAITELSNIIANAGKIRDRIIEKKKQATESKATNR